MSPPRRSRDSVAVRIAVAALLVLFAVLAVTSARRTSATWDEPRYLGLGRYLILEGRWDLPSITTTPPLTFYLNSLLLPFTALDEACFKKGALQDIGAGVRRGQCLMRGSHPGGDELLFLSRLPFIGVGLLLGLLVFHWSRQLFGDSGGLLSLALYVTCPNILASTRLINQDITLSALGLATIYACWRWREAAWASSGAPIVGALLGLVLGAKYPGLLFVPMVVGLWGIRMLSPGEREGTRSGGVWRPLMQLVVVIGVAAFVLGLLYRFQPGAYTGGFRVMSRLAANGFPTFLNGEVSRHGGWWTYYLNVAAMKTPLPAIAIYLAGAVALLTRRSTHRWLPLFLLAPPLVVVGAMSGYRTVNAGLRYILPAYPFLMVMAGAVVGAVGRTGRLALALLVGWCGVEAVSIHPHYLAYFNQAIGGPEQGYRHLLDGNLGWGGDLKELAEFARRNRIAKIKLSYHGTALPELYGLAYEPLRSFMLPRRPKGQMRLIEGDWVAVSAENLEPLFVDLGDIRRFLKPRQPDAVIGHSIFVYHLTDPQRRLQVLAVEDADRPPEWAGR